MTEDVGKVAEALAELPYSERIFIDESAPAYARYAVENPELPGCIPQGPSIDEARESLREIRVDYIESLLRDNVQVPRPIVTHTSAPDVERLLRACESSSCY